jgi:hypothetical protein
MGTMFRQRALSAHRGLNDEFLDGYACEHDSSPRNAYIRCPQWTFRVVCADYACGVRMTGPDFESFKR